MKRGVLYGLTAYVLWGAFPLYFPLLQPGSALEILSHRVVWSFVTMAIVLLVVRRWRTFSQLPIKVWAQICAAAVFIAANWGIYIYAVNNGHVVEAALGYFINPLVSVCLGVLVLKERLRPLQWTALAVAASAVVVIVVDTGQIPWLSLGLAASFATYGLIKKVVPLRATESLGAESMVLMPVALGYLIYLQISGGSNLLTNGPWHVALLASAGLVTVVPLAAFAMAAPRLPLSTMGFLQYLTPVLQFLLGILVFQEQMPPARWIGFIIIWCALALYTFDALRAQKRAPRNRQAVRTVPAPGQ
ncbi:EamA family transporter RarD [Nakamurella antarctica]|uniref:EamA family transporter RarD n=1 Tax=Nakamurella antarctica TaxID=1902245 RepID=A0A3G8ZWA9_9ACTN|nr:EamA family transporter RarD [Nakamurella antarctica]AZI58724.1 EamA family transporter RarD [Nakamurella antarctica]